VPALSTGELPVALTALLQTGKTYRVPMAKPTYRGRVKFFRPDKGWGAIVSAELAHDVWVHFATIDGSDGFRSLDDGDEVEFRYEDCWGSQDSWHYRTTWVRRTSPSKPAF